MWDLGELLPITKDHTDLLWTNGLLQYRSRHMFLSVNGAQSRRECNFAPSLAMWSAFHRSSGAEVGLGVGGGEVEHWKLLSIRYGVQSDFRSVCWVVSKLHRKEHFSKRTFFHHRDAVMGKATPSRRSSSALVVKRQEYPRMQGWQPSFKCIALFQRTDKKNEFIVSYFISLPCLDFTFLSPSLLVPWVECQTFPDQSVLCNT